MARKTRDMGRMREEDELCLQKHLSEIENTIEAKDITGTLFERDIIDTGDMDEIKLGDSKIERARRFLAIIIMRGPNAFKRFIETLDSTGYRDLAAKLKGCGTTTRKEDCDGANSLSGDVTNLRHRVDDIEKNRAMAVDLGNLRALVEDYHGANNLNKDVLTLRLRIDAVKKNRAMEVDLETLRSEFKEELDNLSSTLIKIEELSRVSKETENTVNSLQKQLKEKDKLLSDAKDQIDVLKSKIGTLERESATLRHRTDQQEARRKQDSKDTKDKFAQMELETKEAKEKSTRETKETKDRFAQMELDAKEAKDNQVKLMNMFQKQLEDAMMKKATPRQNVKQTPIVPRNRFQKP